MAEELRPIAPVDDVRSSCPHAAVSLTQALRLFSLFVYCNKSLALGMCPEFFSSGGTLSDFREGQLAFLDPIYRPSL